MSEYHKIQTVFKRDPATNQRTLLEGEYSEPEFEYLKDNKWIFTEKVDGTNIRVMFSNRGEGLGEIRFGGRTDRASIPAPLLAAMLHLFTTDKMCGVFDSDAVLYGEGYGARIQRGGDNYRPDQSFVLFDIRVGDWWLKRGDVEEVAESLGIGIVPIIATGTLDCMVEFAREGFRSDWGDFQAEGIVARPDVELVGRSGRRVITKIKCKDFKAKPTLVRE